MQKFSEQEEMQLLLLTYESKNKQLSIKKNHIRNKHLITPLSNGRSVLRIYEIKFGTCFLAKIVPLLKAIV